MATVRIYKVAEVLDTTSQEVIALLKRDHGIEVKSASSTIEEVVARQFVERVARERRIAVPSRHLFEDAPVAAKDKGARARRTAEPAKPVSAPLPPPRLVKTPRPAPPVEEEPTEHEEVAETLAEEPPLPETEPTPVAALAPPSVPGRVVPPTLRLRIEESTLGESGETRTPAPPSRLTPPAAARAPRQTVKPQAPGSAATPVTARPAVPTPRPLTPLPPRPPLGGPRPLPTPPVRPTTPGAPRPGFLGRPPPRPYRPTHGRRTGPPVRRQPRPAAPPPEPPPPVTRTITLAEGMTVKDLADKLDVRAKDVLKKLLDRRLMMTINSTLDTETATTLARDFGADVQIRTFEEEIVDVESEQSKAEDFVPRAPVVTVMGHVDHGKTTLLDAIRETKVAEQEAGGITQHIGAYAVQVNGRQVVFLDTPGHEAFTLMRARGARVTDVVILVVAADDGVMPQTREAIDHARAAEVPLLVAINKIDRPGANSERVKRELADLGLAPEDWGGHTVMVEISAKKRQNLDLMLEMILLVTELGEHKANPKRNAAGTVLEAKLDRGRGPVATVLVQDGTLHVGNAFIAGTVVGKVRALIDDHGRHVKDALPSTPVEVLGVTGLPQPGDAFQAVTDPARARQIALFRQTQAKDKALGGKGTRLTLESLQQQIAEGNVKELPVIIKADVQGSAEVLADTLAKLSDDRVKLRIVHAAVGAINESDVLLASASNAIVIGFNVRPDRNAQEVVDRESVDIRLHSVIYNVTDEIKKAMSGLLEPTLKEVRLGTAQVREVFKVPKAGTIAGCMITDGRITRSGDAQARILRDNVVVFEGRIGSLRRFKDDVSEVKTGFECGIGIERYNDIKVGDVIEAFAVQQVAAVNQ